MKLRITACLFPLIMSFSSCYANASTKTISITEVAHELEKQGYHTIQKIKHEPNNYEVNVINKQGNKLKLRMNAENGAILNPPKNKNSITLMDAMLLLEKAGYKNIQAIESKKSFYKAEILNAQGKKVAVKVDFDKGIILKG